MLVQRGTLRIGDSVVAGDAFGHIRAMLDDNGDNVDEAGPSRPVLVLGLTSVPGAGDSLLVVEEDRIARQIADRRSARERNAQLAQNRRRISLDDLDKALAAGEVESLNLIIKGDVSGSVEALEDALLNIDIGEDRDEVSLRVIGRGVGAINENDVNLAMASDAVIIGFNVRPAGKAGEIAQREGWMSATTRLSIRPSTRSRPRSRACSSRNTRRCSSARPRCARSSGFRESATSPARSCVRSDPTQQQG